MTEEQIHKVSEVESPDESDLEYAANLLIEAQKIQDNDALYKNVMAHSKKIANTYTSIGDLRSAADEMNLNPGKSRREE